MCSLFGWLDYQGIVPYKIKRKLTQALANAAEERGTDAAGISYVHGKDVVIFKRPKPAHKLHFSIPERTVAVMGHTRMTTQGDEKHNYNNHPFPGLAGGTAFAFAHNGVLWNDKELRKEKQLPYTHIETDSYVAVQLLQQSDKLDFESLKDMAEVVEGNFTFSVLDQNNSLYIIKGSNPMCLLHFPALGLYVYASTESIMKNALKRVGLHKFAYERVQTDEGDILRIDKNGVIERSEFEPRLFRSRYGGWHDWEAEHYSVHEELLLAYCGCYGVDSSDVELLLEYGYTCDEIEEMLADHNLLNEALRDVKYMCGGELYENCYGGVY
ncbi:class II glutamine amidotransferase [Ruminococcus sp. XPD3002]|uniref:class II glutamine amidotransferase n=1 Tax=Ruminococcus sp. XPD3002 TaxID=1452269 RepID=UPI000923E911|nr:Glutamine amidotransferase domain-containing protein [Ruminococcus flavefaciens]